MVDLSNLLNKRVDDIESPKPVPAGTYIGVIAGAPDLSKSFKKRDEKTGSETEIQLAEVEINLTEAGPDVDEDLLNSAGGLRRKDGKPKSVRMTYFLEEEELHRIKKLGKDLGIAAETLGGIFEEMQGKDVRVQIIVQPDKNDPEIQYNRVKKVIAA